MRQDKKCLLISRQLFTFYGQICPQNQDICCLCANGFTFCNLDFRSTTFLRGFGLLLAWFCTCRSFLWRYWFTKLQIKSNKKKQYAIHFLDLISIQNYSFPNRVVFVLFLHSFIPSALHLKCISHFLRPFYIDTKRTRTFIADLK